ncbi:hypothetical protein AMECASPLE_015737 [Ameca splendens]|uniref:Secreted protein n=1 Tax=Ameca splendens TaxID=208324 RepID=A0ABV0XR07_9TELE
MPFLPSCAWLNGVMLTGAAQTHLILLSASSLSTGGREDGSSGKDAICGNCTDMPLCFDTILTASFGFLQTAVQQALCDPALHM